MERRRRLLGITAAVTVGFAVATWVWPNWVTAWLAGIGLIVLLNALLRWQLARAR